MIEIRQFTIHSKERRKKQEFLDVDIKPTRNQFFVFYSSEDLQKFEDELRQTFEVVFPFGCEVSANFDNQLVS